jgi:hypothetical protein
MRLRYLILASGTLLLVSLLAYTPAGLLIPDPQRGPVILESVQGHWRAGSGRLRTPSPAPDMDLRWTLDASNLLLAELSYQLSGDGDGAQFVGDVTLTPSRLVTIDDLMFSWRATEMPLVGPLPGTASFHASTTDAHIAIDGSSVVSADGVLELRELFVRSYGQELALGDYRATLSAVDGNLKLTTLTDDALLGVSGDLFMNLQGRIWGVLLLRPHARTPEQLAIGVATVGRSQGDGRFSINIDIQL